MTPDPSKAKGPPDPSNRRPGPRERPAVRCSAKRTDGQPCKAWAIHGGTVCRAHGGSAPQVRAKAEQTYRRRLALAEIERLYGPPGEVDPGEVIARELTRSEALIAWLADLLVLDLDDLESVAAQLEQLRRERAHLATVADRAIRAGIADRQAAASETFADQLRVALEAMGVDAEARARFWAALEQLVTEGG